MISKTLKTIIFTLIACTLIACDDIPQDKRLIPLPTIQAQRVVILEEFTGQWCVNCPAAHKTIQNLLTQYPDNLIPISIHAGGDPFSIGENQYPGVIGLRNQQGEDLASQFGIKSFPMAVINRNTPPLTSDDWSAAIRNEVTQPSDISLSATATIIDQNIKIDITATPYQNLDVQLHVWVTENNITAIQMLQDGSIDTNYIHNHVFRQAATPLDGQPLTLTTRQPLTTQIQTPLLDHWNPKNLTIIAFLTNTDRQIIQATKTIPTQK